MTLIEQAIQAEQEYKNKMKEATDRLKHILISTFRLITVVVNLH